MPEPLLQIQTSLPRPSQAPQLQVPQQGVQPRLLPLLVGFLPLLPLLPTLLLIRILILLSWTLLCLHTILLFRADFFQSHFL